MLAVVSIMGSGTARVSEVLVVVALKMYLGLCYDHVQLRDLSSYSGRIAAL